MTIISFFPFLFSSFFFLSHVKSILLTSGALLYSVFLHTVWPLFTILLPSFFLLLASVILITPMSHPHFLLLFIQHVFIKLLLCARNWSRHKYKRNVFFLIFYLFTYLFMTVLGLRFCARAFSSCGKRGPLLIAVRRPLTIAASLVAERRLQTRRLSSCGARV